MDPIELLLIGAVSFLAYLGKKDNDETEKIKKKKQEELRKLKNNEVNS